MRSATATDVHRGKTEPKHCDNKFCNPQRFGLCARGYIFTVPPTPAASALSLVHPMKAHSGRVQIPTGYLSGSDVRLRGSYDLSGALQADFSVPSRPNMTRVTASACSESHQCAMYTTEFTRRIRNASKTRARQRMLSCTTASAFMNENFGVFSPARSQCSRGKVPRGHHLRDRL